MQSVTKVPDQVGYLLLHETGATISSSGELENDEKTAEAIFNLVTLTDKLDPLAFPSEAFNKISICYKDFCYIICMSNKKIHVVKRKISAGLNTSTEPHLIDLQDIGDEGFNIIQPTDIDELVDESLLNVDELIEFSKPDDDKTDDELEDVVRPLTTDLIRESLNFAKSLEEHFLTHDPDTELALKSQRKLNCCMDGYQELYKEFQKPKDQPFMADFIIIKN